MRRLLTAVALAGMTGLLLGACTKPGGVDGDLVNDWAPMAEAKPFVPEVGACHPAPFVRQPPLTDYRPVDCSEPHRTETSHVGAFSGAAAERVDPPPAGSPEIRAAYLECDGRARAYVGDEWRAGRLWLGVALPTNGAWKAGARWFRCDMTELAMVQIPTVPVSRTTSLRGALTADSPLRLGCHTMRAGAGRSMQALPVTDCGKEHNGEFVGVWIAPETTIYPSRDADWVGLYEGCYRLLATYVGVTESTVRFRSGVVAVPAAEADWKAGDRGVRCYLWRSDGKFTRSLKGVGEKGLPLRTG